MDEIAATCPREDRTPDRRVFPGFTPDVAKNVMARACKAAGIVHRHPHDLRHRYASVQIGRGIPVTTVAAQLGRVWKQGADGKLVEVADPVVAAGTTAGPAAEAVA